eukprot:CAMPEP_0172569450 /NCGR_PEP_ID=MMETSP1067-20121228/123505_1 /TAXON_ID=265564 ORGANISM="Thalassiosira punctigera, Strain Tpunct2005C2" /NCGR_SAMPLE_ID=MMETSP1067 /ASSEMBLY_ACC=CAM_ASM_000444 /LENGTH=49 /DNA_ID= /DNA_START= /DNA_END= /DNA_ORIENTATION=
MTQSHFARPRQPRPKPGGAKVGPYVLLRPRLTHCAPGDSKVSAATAAAV